MAETVVINIEANTTGLQSTIDLLVKLGQVEQKVADDFRKTNEANVKSLQQGVTQTTGQFDKLSQSVKSIKTDNKLAESLDATAPLAKTGNSLKTFQQQLKEAQKQLNLLAAEYGPLDARTLAAAKNVEELKGNIEDTNRAVNALKPEGKFQAIQNLGGAIAGVFQVATGALQAFGVESEQATKIAQQFQGALNIFAGLSQLTALQDSLKSVRAAFGITTAATVANTAATEAATAANVANTAALEGEAVASQAAAVGTNAFTAALAANPIAGILVSITALVGALYALGDAYADVDENQRAINQARSEALASVSEEVTKVDILVKKYQDNNTSLQDRIKIGKELVLGYPEYFSNLDIEKGKYVDLTDAAKKLTDELVRKATVDQLVKNIADINLKISQEQTKSIGEQTDAIDKLQAGATAFTVAVTDALTLGLIDDLDATTEATAALGAAAKDNTKKTVEGLEAQKKAYEDYLNSIVKTEDLTQKQKEAEEKAAKEAAERLKREKEARDKANQERLKASAEAAKKQAEDEGKIRNELSEKELKQDLDNLEQYQTRRIEQINQGFDDEQRAAIDAQTQANLENVRLLEANLISYEEYEKRKAKIAEGQPNASFERQKAIASQELAGLELRKKNLEDYGKSTTDIDKKIADKKNEINELTTKNEEEQSAKRTKNAEDEAKAKLEAIKKAEELRAELNKKIVDLGVDTFIQGINNAFTAQIDNIKNLKEEQLKAIEEEDEKIQESYDNRTIGKRQFELEQERLTKERVKAEEQAEKRISAIRKRQDIANKAKALFEIFLNTRRSVTAIQADPTLPTVAKPALIAQTIIFGGIQAASVLAQPLPKYKKGTLSIPGTGNEDSHMAMLQPGEAVIPTETNKKYHPAIKAIYEEKISAKEINSFVKERIYDKRVMPSELKEFVSLKLKPDMSKNVKADSVTAKMDVSDLYALGRIMRKNDGVTVKNIKELASIFADNYNPRR